MQEINRVLFVISGLEKGGAETQLYRLIQALLRDGEIKITVFSLRGGHYLSLLRKLKVNVIVSDTSITNITRSIALFNKTVRESNPQLIHSWLPHANVFTKISLILKNRKIPLVTGIRVKEKKYWFQMIIERLLDFRCAQILVNQKAIIPHLRSYTFSHHKIAYVGNIFLEPQVNSDHVKDILKKYQAPIILTVGHFRPQKNYFVNLMALKLLHENQSFRAIYIGGPGKDLSKVKEYIKKNNMDYVTILPANSEVVDYMKACDVLFLPSLYEGQSNVLMEAIGVGTCIVSSNLVENKWLDGAAFFGNPKSAQDMCEQLEEALKAPSFYRKLEQIQTFIKQQHDSKTIVKNYKEVYSEVLTHVRN